jgi:glucan phosphoethanolaminetransferase (alkaline phosphatase superfamily)
VTQAFFREESEKWSIPKDIVYAVLFFFLWEAASGLFAKRMDWVDIIASVISGCYTYVLYLLFRFKHIGGYKE